MPVPSLAAEIDRIYEPLIARADAIWPPKDLPARVRDSNGPSICGTRARFTK